MIRCIRKEPILNKTLKLIIVNSIFISIIFISFQYYFLNQIHKEQINLNQIIVGKFIKLYPEKEVDIINTVIKNNDKDLIDLGNKTLSKYGYDVNVKVYEDDIFKVCFLNFMFLNGIVCFIFITINIYFFIYESKYFIDKLENFSKALDKIIDGDFSEKVFSDEEGVLSRIYIQFEQMVRRIENNLNALEKEKENIKSLITDISHQLKTPLSSVKMFNLLLLEEDVDEVNKKNFLNRSNENINKLEWLIGSLLKLSRLEIGMINLKKETGDINETIYKAVNQSYIKASEKNIDISVERLKECFVIHDIKWTMEAIFNVIENAIKYTNKGGFIKIILIKSEAYVRIDIKDNGIGIPKGEMNNVFKRFYRGTTKMIQANEGSGVGLYLTRKILEEQGGCITVTSEVGKGTVFSLFLQNCYKNRKNIESFE